MRRRNSNFGAIVMIALCCLILVGYALAGALTGDLFITFDRRGHSGSFFRGPAAWAMFGAILSGSAWLLSALWRASDPSHVPVRGQNTPFERAAKYLMFACFILAMILGSLRKHHYYFY